MRGHAPPIQTSLRTAQFDSTRHSIDLMLREADSALYAVKRERREAGVKRESYEAAAWGGERVSLGR